MMAESYFSRSEENSARANAPGDLFQSFDGLMDDLFDLDPPPGSPRASDMDFVPSSPVSGDNWRSQNPSNAVHMYVQENSKLPVLNCPVDRKKNNPSPDFQVDPSKLAESFLSNDRRQSYHANYQQVGALSQSSGIGRHGGRETHSNERRDSLDADVLEAFLADIDPTPLSEIKKRHAAHHPPNTSTMRKQAPPLYTRKAMLPIPTEKISPPVSPETKRRRTAEAPPPMPPEPMQSAVATAAALAAARPKPPVAASKYTPVAINRTFEQKSQYGFGSNHVVPSVPAPPQQRRTFPLPRQVPSPPMSGKDLGHGDAYERKKQRAKDARVKLNESIERLSVAIALAGTQSRERRQQWQDIPDSPMHDTCMQIMNDCIDCAESAKKWDRPSFVGSAASLIQGLNAQCEAMMREIMRLREDGGAVPTVPTPPTTIVSTESLEMAECTSTKRSADAALGHGDAKRSRTEFAVDLTNAAAVWNNVKLRHKIIGYLDPLSLLRCQRVNRLLQSSASQEDVWSALCTARFGYFNVRQWRAKLDDEEEGIKAQSSTLYRSMDRANVMGPFQHEGLFLLGEARLPNKVSAWVFLVERSNGETMRSVRRKSDMPGNGVYTTLPIVELRTIVQNTGIMNEAVIIREQLQCVDASTRRRGDEMTEVDWDKRFSKRVFNLDGSPYNGENQAALTGCLTRPAELCRLKLFESVIFTTFIHAKGCSTNSKFVQRANFTKILVALDSGVTVPLVVPFPRDASHLQH